MHNERVRLFAQAVSTFGIGSLLAGVITPFATTHTGSTDFWGWLVAGSLEGGRMNAYQEWWFHWMPYFLMVGMLPFFAYALITVYRRRRRSRKTA